MGLSVFPAAAAASGGIKLVQRGAAGSSGTVTITAVDMSKAFVNVFGTTSSGTVAATGTVASSSDTISYLNDGTAQQMYNAGGYTARGTISRAASAISGGTTNLVAAVIQGYLSSSTQLVVSGACRWEVVEFN